MRLQVMRLLSENPERSTRDIADAVGISNGGAYYVLTALIEKGFVKLENFKKIPQPVRLPPYTQGLREKSS